MDFDFADMKRAQYKTKRIMAKNLYVSNDTWETGLNNNDMIIGPSGAGKTRGYVLPNIRLGNESMVITDTKGALYHELKDELEKQGYEVLNIDFTNLDAACGYNPLDFVRFDAKSGLYDEQDIMTIAATVVPVKPDERDPFWNTAAQGVLAAIIAFVLEALPKEMHSFEYVGKFVDELTSDVVSKAKDGSAACNQWAIERKLRTLFGKEPERILDIVEVEPDDEWEDEEESVCVKPISFVDLMNDLAARNPESCAVKMYRSQILPFGSAERTFDSVRAILNAGIAKLTFRSVTEVYKRKPKVDMKALGEKKTALFLTVSDTDRSQDKLVNIFYAQLFQKLCRSADWDYPEHCLPVPVRIYLDDFATNTYIEDFDKIIAVIRSREIYVSIILQSISQLEALYGAARAATIINNCDHCLYLGGQDIRTAEFVSMKTDKAPLTILTMPLDHVYLFERGKEPMYLSRVSEEV